MNWKLIYKTKHVVIGCQYIQFKMYHIWSKKATQGITLSKFLNKMATFRCIKYYIWGEKKKKSKNENL